MLSANRTQIYCFCFSVIPFWPHILENVQKQDPNKKKYDRIGFASSNPPVPRSQVLLRCLGLFRNWVFSFLRKSSVCVQCVCSMIECLRVQAIAMYIVRNINFSVFFEISYTSMTYLYARNARAISSTVCFGSIFLCLCWKLKQVNLLAMTEKLLAS